MVDWITLAIELVGLAILVTWVVIPVREFRQILRVVKRKPHAMPDAASDASRHGFPVETSPTQPREDGRRG